VLEKELEPNHFDLEALPATFQPQPSQQLSKLVMLGGLGFLSVQLRRQAIQIE
jgi:hypothetical protein